MGKKLVGLGLAAALAAALGGHTASPASRHDALDSAIHRTVYRSAVAARAADRRDFARARRPLQGGAIRTWHRGAVWYVSEAVSGADCVVASGVAAGRVASFAVVAGDDDTCRTETARAAQIVARLAQRGP